jgi:hypothetical protein
MILSNYAFGQIDSDENTIHGKCLDGTDFWRQGVVDITQIGKDGQVFVNQKSHIISSVLHRNNQSETIHLRLQITSPHPDSKMDQTKQIIFDKCDSIALVDWTFTPMVPGKHKVELRIQEGGSGYSSSFIVKDPDGKSLRDYIPSPLKQYESGVKPSQIVCKVPLQMVLRIDGTPACVKQSTMVELWDQGWIRPADEYAKFSSKQLREQFQSKILSKEIAIKISQNYLRDNNLSINLNMSDPRSKVSAELFYAQLAEGQQAQVDVKFDTGLPVESMPPWSEKFYRNPQWWAELQKDYLGMKSHRIEQGNLVWGVTYNEHPECICIGNSAEFLIDAITGKIIRVPPPELLTTKHTNTDPDSNYREMTILDVSPKNVTLPEPKVKKQPPQGVLIQE